MNIEIEQYYNFGDDITHISFEVPDDAIVVKLQWKKFGKRLKRYSDINKYPDDSNSYYTNDYYIVFNINNSDKEKWEECNALRNPLTEFMYIKEKYDKLILLIRLCSCEITNEDIKFSTLEELNSKIDLSRQFYTESIISKEEHKLNIKKILEYREKKDITYIEDIINNLEKNSKLSYDIFYYHPINLVNDGFYTQIVGVHKDYRYHDADKMNDTIFHDVMDFDYLQEQDFDFQNKKITHNNSSLKPKYYGRINEIIFK